MIYILQGNVTASATPIEQLSHVFFHGCHDVLRLPCVWSHSLLGHDLALLSIYNSEETLCQFIISVWGHITDL